jgi:hypothetical protein
MPKVKMYPTLPDGDHNGLLAQHKRLSEPEPPGLLVAVALIDRKALVQDDDTHVLVPQMRVRRIEVITDKEDAESLTRLLLREFERRRGQPVLPLAMEGEIDEALRAAVDHGIETPDETGEEQ